MIRAAHTVALAEGLSFANRVGLDAALTADLLGLQGAEEMLKGSFAGQGELRQHTRDLGYALEVAQEAGLLAPLTATTNEIFKAVAAHADSSWNEAAIIRYWE
jgi:3-hydroxyisobutyrate dehydrogenase-like beta-hydroxyacid dehydrogenase